MIQKNQIYKCEICGNIVEVVHEGSGQLVCCGQPMIKLDEKTKDEGLEKHIPIIEKVENGYLVKVGQTEHPMEENHHIEWIELVTDNRVYRKYLMPADKKPEAKFLVNAENVTAREHCNIHGLWKSE